MGVYSRTQGNVIPVDGIVGALGTIKKDSEKSEKIKHHHNDDALWGRYYLKDALWSFLITCVFICTPPLTLMAYIVIADYNGSLMTPVIALLEGESFHHVILEKIPVPTIESLKIMIMWIVFQALLYLYLPGVTGLGQKTPAGVQLKYNVNGARAFILTHILAFYLVGSGYMSSTIIYDHWGPLLMWANIFGFALAAFAYFKAYTFPCHPKDCKRSGNRIYDFYMGIEMNPRIGDLDFKLFFNGRIGIIAWNLINLSFCAAHYQKYGQLSNSIILVTLLQELYIVDFFLNEDWYLRTIDICHDHFGWMLAWGDSVWLPWMYTLQGFYLVKSSYELSQPLFYGILVFGIVGYTIFRVTNNQKNQFRKEGPGFKIWGSVAKYIPVSYRTHDGDYHTSTLLISGFWGISRHFNYFGDLILSTCFSLCCGFGHLLPYFYPVYMGILLCVRVERDNLRCSQKYGKDWSLYCDEVPYKIVPYIY